MRKGHAEVIHTEFLPRDDESRVLRIHVAGGVYVDFILPNALTERLGREALELALKEARAASDRAIAGVMP